VPSFGGDQEASPERFRFGGADVHAQDLVAAIPLTPIATLMATETIRPFWAHLHVGRIDPQIGPIAVDRAVSCRGERGPAVTSTASLDETMFEAPLSRLRKVAYVPDVELARRFRTALY
jgi:hypothetical protein